MDGTTTYETDEHGYPTPLGMLQIIQYFRDECPNDHQKLKNDLSYMLGYIRSSLGLAQ